MLSFNHVILAIRLPDSQPFVMPVLQHEKLGRLLLFDPTDSSTPLGYLPPTLQASHGLLVTDSEGELISTPLLPPSNNRLLRTAKFTLDGNGTLKGTLEETRVGPFATELRERLLDLPAKQRQTVLQSILTEMIDGAVLTGARIEALRDSGAYMSVFYDITVPAYAQQSGKLFLFRSCVLGHKASSVLESKPRTQPMIFPNTTLETDMLEISLPPEYAIDELPKGVKYEYPFATYRSEMSATGQVLRYNRAFERKDVRIPLEKVSDLKKLYTDIADDERTYAVLSSNHSEPK
jgi:hypothetical protein